MIWSIFLGEDNLPLLNLKPNICRSWCYFGCLRRLRHCANRMSRPKGRLRSSSVGCGPAPEGRASLWPARLRAKWCVSREAAATRGIATQSGGRSPLRTGRCRTLRPTAACERTCPAFSLSSRLPKRLTRLVRRTSRSAARLSQRSTFLRATRLRTTRRPAFRRPAESSRSRRCKTICRRDSWRPDRCVQRTSCIII